MDDAQKALEENDKFTVSSRFQDAQTQWGLALKDCKVIIMSKVFLIGLYELAEKFSALAV